MGFLLYFLYRFLKLYVLVLLARCIMSFFGYSKVYEVLCAVTEPVLKPIRNILMKTPLGDMPFDFSPVFAMLLIGVVESVVW